MTKKDYIKIVAILKSHREKLPADVYNGIVADFAKMLKADNPNFKDAKFVEACSDD